MRDFLRRNSSTILTCVGAVGVVATTVMAVKATPKALSLIEDAKGEKGEELTKFEIVKIAGPTYIPTAITGLATIACIFGSNVINKHQQAALMSAYALVDNSYKEYKKKVDELYGEEAGKEVRAEIAKDKYTGDGTLVDDDKELFYDFYSGQYFESTREMVLWAQYETNRAMAVNDGVSVNEFYDFLGLEPIEGGDYVGWTHSILEQMYWDSWIEFEWEQIVIDEHDDGYGGLECTIIHMTHEPVIEFLDGV